MRRAVCAGCLAEQDYGRIRCLSCGLPLVFPAAEDVKPSPPPIFAEHRLLHSIFVIFAQTAGLKNPLEDHLAPLALHFC